MSTTYHANKQKKRTKVDPHLTLALFTRKDGKPFTLIDPLVIATATYHSCANAISHGSFANNLTCAACGKCALHLEIALPDSKALCRKCGREEVYDTRVAIEFFWLHQKTAPATGMQEDDEAEDAGRIELAMAPV